MRLAKDFLSLGARGGGRGEAAADTDGIRSAPPQPPLTGAYKRVLFDSLRMFAMGHLTRINSKMESSEIERHEYVGLQALLAAANLQIPAPG
jgi:hypothetical protein